MGCGNAKVDQSFDLTSRAMLKDYYKILELTPQASVHDIRKSFRKLAMRYHPDKHPEDQVASAQFREIQEAYEILNDPWRREQYHQERWYAQSMGRMMKDSAPPNSGTILQELLALEKHLSRQDPFRTDQYGLFTYLEHILSDEALEILKQENNEAMLSEILRLSLACGNFFSYSLALRLADRLHRLFPAGQPGSGPIDNYLRARKNDAMIERWKIPVLLAITIIICILIFLAA
jgi:curved DNA-binding protein CbpA